MSKNKKHQLRIIGSQKVIAERDNEKFWMEDIDQAEYRFGQPVGYYKRDDETGMYHKEY